MGLLSNIRISCAFHIGSQLIWATRKESVSYMVSRLGYFHRKEFASDTGLFFDELLLKKRMCFPYRVTLKCGYSKKKNVLPIWGHSSMGPLSRKRISPFLDGLPLKKRMFPIWGHS